MATFTFAGALDLLFISMDGGQFCGPASVERSRASTAPFSAGTELAGTGPLLVIAATQRPDLEAAGMLDGEVVE